MKQIESYIRSGFSTMWIVYELDCSPALVRKVAVHYNLQVAKALRPTSPDGQMALDLHKAGCSVDEIAVVIERPTGVISEFLEKYSRV